MFGISGVKKGGTETTPVHLLHPGTIAEDALTRLIKEVAGEVLAAALQAEVDGHVDRFRTVIDAHGKRRVVRNGYLSGREIRTGAGKFAIKQPRVRVNGRGPDNEQLRFENYLIPPYLRKAKSVEQRIPCPPGRTQRMFQGLSFDNSGTSTILDLSNGLAVTVH